VPIAQIGQPQGHIHFLVRIRKSLPQKQAAAHAAGNKNEPLPVHVPQERVSKGLPIHVLTY
jgi:hypothetical protein